MEPGNVPLMVSCPLYTGYIKLFGFLFMLAAEYMIFYAKQYT
jgi:hypothetical protein